MVYSSKTNGVFYIYHPMRQKFILKKSHRTFFHSFETNPRRSCLDMMLSYELQTILPTKKPSGRKQLKRDNGGIYKVIKWFIAQHLVFGGVVLSGKLC